MVTASTPPPSLQDIALDDLVFDPRLQCRDALDPSTVDDYAAALRADPPVQFPPIRVRVVDGVRYVVDGWHRAEAHRKAERPRILAELEPGTWADAVLEAVGANANHGLRRNNETKRRAVLTLLQADTWAGLSNRELAGLAGVTHPLVGKLRREYGVAKGERLTTEHRNRVEGRLPEAWETLVTRASPYDQDLIEDLAQATSIADIVESAKRIEGVIAEAANLRCSELAVGTAWPWPMDDDELRQDRVRTMDDVADIEAALVSEGCPDRATLLRVLKVARRIPRLGEYSDLGPSDQDLIRSRPALQAVYEERRAAIKAEVDARPPSAWQQREAIAAIEDPTEQAAAVGAAEEEVALRLSPSKLSEAGRARLRHRIDQRRRLDEKPETEDCHDPTCWGWYEAPSQWRSHDQTACIHCNKRRDEVDEWMAAVLAKAGQLLWVRQDLTMQVDGVPVDQSAVELLRRVERFADHGDLKFERWLQHTPNDLTDAVEGYLEGPVVAPEAEGAA
jgi:hypothetical protein